MVVEYIVLANRAVERHHVVEALRPALGPAIEEATMGFADRVYAEGKAEGEARGKTLGLEEGRAQGLVEGLAKGTAMTLLRFFESRGFALTDTQKERILSCQDLAQLDDWVARVATASSVKEVLGDE